MELQTSTTRSKSRKAAGATPRGTVRVLHVVRSLGVGGLEVVLLNLVGVLRRQGFEQAVCCLEDKGPLAERLPHDVPAWSCRAMNRSRWNRHEFRAISVFRNYRPDVIHACNYGAWIDAAFARAAALNPGRLAFTMHGWDRVARMPRRRAFACRLLARLTDGMAAVSPQTAREFANETGIPESRFEILNSGIDTDRFCPPALRSARTGGKLVLACVARLDPVKGHSTLLDAIALLQKDEAGDFELRLIGDGPMRPALEEQVARLNLKECVRFLGTRDDLPEQLRDADMFVLASDREGRPISIMEAMSAGLPVVTTNVGSIGDLVDDGESGFVVESGKPGEFARALALLARHPELRKKMSEAARNKAVGEFSLERMGRDYTRFYEGLVSGRIGRRASLTR
jgi:glycosyltransferase involved in cell wall biosynthesis